MTYKKYDELFNCMIEARQTSIKNYVIDINDSYTS